MSHTMKPRPFSSLVKPEISGLDGGACFCWVGCYFGWLWLKVTERFIGDYLPERLEPVDATDLGRWVCES